MKKLQRYLIIILVILMAELVDAYFILVLQKYKSSQHPYRSTFIHMCVMVVIYYPLIAYLDKYLKTGSQQIVKQSQKIADNRHLGLIIAFVLGVLLTWIALASIWYDANMFVDLARWLRKTL